MVTVRPPTGTGYNKSSKYLCPVCQCWHSFAYSINNPLNHRLGKITRRYTAIQRMALQCEALF